MRELVPYLRLLLKRRHRLLLGMVLMLVTVLAAVGLLALSGWLITATAVTAALWAAGTRVAFDIYIPGGAIRFFALTRTVARYIERIYNHDTVLRLLADLRTGVFAALTRLDALTLSRLRSGILLNRLTADIDALDNLYLRLLAPPLVALAGSIGVALLLWWWLPVAGLLTLIILIVLLMLTTLVCAYHGRSDSEQLLTISENLRLRLLEQFRGLAELIAYKALPRHRQLFIDEENLLLDHQRQLGRRLAGYNALVTAVIQILTIVVLALALFAFQAGNTSAALAVLMPLAVLALGEALTVLPAGSIQFGATCAAARRLTTEIHRPPAMPPATGAVTPRSADIHLTSLVFCYPQAETAVLDGVDLTIADGELVAITGQSGAGKSTLADLLAGLRRPDAGSLLLGGICIDRLAVSERRERIAYLTQRSDMFEASIADNLRIAEPEAGAADLWRVLHSVALADWVEKLPQGLDTWIGESGRRISGGQGRRLALARILLRTPQLVLLDEPFAGLDRSTIETIASRIRPWLRERTTILFCHDASTLPGIDRGLMLENGVLIQPRI